MFININVTFHPTFLIQTSQQWLRTLMPHFMTMIYIHRPQDTPSSGNWLQLGCASLDCSHAGTHMMTFDIYVVLTDGAQSDSER